MATSVTLPSHSLPAKDHHVDFLISKLDGNKVLAALASAGWRKPSPQPVLEVVRQLAGSQRTKDNAEP